MSNNGYTQKKYSEIKPGEVFAFAGYEWIKLEQEGLALMSESNAYSGYYGVRPLCNLSSESLVSVPGEEKEEDLCQSM